MTLNRPTIHHHSISGLSLPNPLTYHVPSIVLLYLHPGHLALSLSHPPNPHSPVHLLVMSSPFKSGCHHYFPTRTQFPPSRPSVSLFRSHPLLSRLNPPFRDCTTSVSHSHLDKLQSERIQSFTGFAINDWERGASLLGILCLYVSKKIKEEGGR